MLDIKLQAHENRGGLAQRFRASACRAEGHWFESGALLFFSFAVGNSFLHIDLTFAKSSLTPV